MKGIGVGLTKDDEVIYRYKMSKAQLLAMRMESKPLL